MSFLPQPATTAWKVDGLRTPWAGVTCRWYPSDAEETYRAEGNRYRPDSFGYEFNEFGYRCDSFSMSDEAPIIWIGCSNTIGIGLPLEEVYAHVATQKIATALGRRIPYWNLAHGGVSGDYIARVLSLAVPILRPKLVFALFPVICRRELVVDGKIKPFLPQGRYLGAEISNAVVSLYDPDHEAYAMVRNLRMVDLLCRAYGAEFLWSTQELDLAFTRSVPDDLLKKRIPARLFKNSDDVARDLQHAGATAHANLAKIIYPRAMKHLVAK